MKGFVVPEELTVDKLNAMKLHELLAIGLHDLKLHATTEGCVVDMRTYMSQADDGLCHACLAGSVVRHSLNQRDYWRWSDKVAREYNGPNHKAWLYALNWLRQGLVGDALEQMGRKGNFSLGRRITPYLVDKAAWWSDIEQLHKDLVEHDI